MGVNLTSKSNDKDETVVLRGITVPLNSDVGGAFVSDAARNKEKLFSDQRLCEKYGVVYGRYGRSVDPAAAAVEARFAGSEQLEMLLAGSGADPSLRPG